MIYQCDECAKEIENKEDQLAYFESFLCITCQAKMFTEMERQAQELTHVTF